MDTHPNTDGYLSPIFSLQINLGFHRSVQRIPGGMKRRAEAITDDLKNIAMIHLNHSLQDDMMAFPHRLPRVASLMCQFGAAFDISV
jgi:hypothetical protein